MLAIALAVMPIDSIQSSLVPRLSNYCGGGKESLVSIAYAWPIAPEFWGDSILQ